MKTSNKAILIVEKEGIPLSLETIFIDQGFQVFTVTSVEDALIILSTNTIDHILCREELFRKQLLAEQEKINLQKKLTGELNMGLRIHEALLTGEVPRGIPGVEIETASALSNEVDGDFFEFFHPLREVFDLVLGDVMGKGILAALIATAVKTQLTRFAVPPSLPIIFDKETWWHEEVMRIDEIIEHVHRAIVPELIKLEYFVSLIYARVNLKKRTLSYIDCGFTKTIHWKAQEKQAVFLKGDNYPLGMMAQHSYLMKEISFQENDSFIFYSDGVTEARSPSGELFGSERLINLVEAKARENEESLVNAIKKAVIEFQQNETFQDDLSIVIIRIDHHLPIDSRESGVVRFAADLTQLKAARDFVARAALQSPGDAEKMAHDLKLAINEIFCNIVKHGYGPDDTGPILVQVEHDLYGIKLEISDQGHPFDPLKITEPSLFGDKDDGYGWYIIRQLVDQVMYLPKQMDGGWNQVRLYKNYCSKEEFMELLHTLQDQTLIVTPVGENIDAKEAPDFKEKVLTLIEETGVKHVIFDMKELQFVDSSGLGSFLSILRRLNAEGGDLKLVGMTKPVRSMFELVSMHKIFDIYSSSADALQSIKK